ncbi:OmpA family protein, partial [Pseudonocardia sp. KRD-188]|nr:OmpA family protein [Pseudonocardia oceani]
MGYATSADRSRHRPAWLPLAAAALVVPTVLAGLTLLWPRPQIEDGLTRTATESLAAAGITGAGVTFSGRDALLTGVSGPEAQRAVDVVRGVPGVRV